MCCSCWQSWTFRQSLCADPDYKARVTFLPNAKEPTLRFRLVSGPDSLKQSKLFVERFASFRKS